MRTITIFRSKHISDASSDSKSSGKREITLSNSSYKYFQKDKITVEMIVSTGCIKKN